MPLRVEGLTVCIAGRAVVEDVSFELPDAARLAMIGQSGSGKTMTALAILGLTPPGAQVSGSIKLGGRELAGAPDRELAQLRGRAIGTVFQDPLTALDPIRRLGAQVADALSNHYRLSRGERRRRAAQMLDQVGLAGAEGFARRYPHQLSGG
ncbi:MAG: ATP-binding cassette domain-containing protein [Bifidobacteriaceae bacterium]|nr:ATP-binding cassette domain-containing protein [Bifidobacteriaceae bacterium]